MPSFEVRMTRSLSLCCFLFALCVPASTLVAGEPSQDSAVVQASAVVDPPAHISLVEGAAVLERDGQTDSAPTNMPLLAGDRIRTQTGRVEILFADGSTLHLDSQTTVDFQSDELVRLLDGRIRLAIPGANRRVSYRIDAPSASAEITQPGEYRVSVLHSGRADEVELAVLRGAAELANENGRTTLRAGERAFSRADAAPSYAYVFNSATWDAFDRWSEGRRDQRLGLSTQYLPDEVRLYASSFDRYGSWRYESSYGYVWYPTVSIGWRPYYNGRWSTLRPYGWTWIGSDPWAWPTHHYGRWGLSAGLWFWIPGRSWGPAWVSWAYAPGYVSWCPLGWNNRPLMQIVNVNVYNRGYDPWRAWTVVPQHHFAGRSVHVGGVAVTRLDARTRGAFVSRSAGPALSLSRGPGLNRPDGRDYAVARSSTPIRAAGTLGSRRGSTVYTNLGPSESRVQGDRARVMVGGSPTSTAPGARSAAGDSGSGPRSAIAPRPGQARSPAMTAAPQDSGTRGDTRSTVPTGDRYGAGDRTPSRRAVTRDDSPSTSLGTPASRAPGDVDRSTPMVPSRAIRPVAPRGTESAAPIYRGEMPQRPASGERSPYGDGRSPGGIRAVPREMPNTPPPPSAGVDRRGPPPDRPSGPPPSATRDPGPRDSGSRSEGARSRSGGQPAQGTAVPRRGGGR
jgi:hypothetical protein